MIGIAAISLFLLIQDEIPFKAKEDFEIKFDLTFKQRPRTESNEVVHPNESRSDYDKRTSTAQLPHLNLLIKILNVQPTELKLRVIRDDKNTMFSKKISKGMEFKLELGFTDDIKDRIAGYKHVIQFLSSDKKASSQIVIEFDTDGNYFVNGEKRGKI